VINVNKVDYIKVQIVENRDTSYLSDYDKYISSVEFNQKTHRFTYGDIKYKNALDIINELDIKVKAFYNVLDNDNREVYYNEILLAIAELMFRLRIDLGVKS
jgi:hypothetical protein